MALCAFSGVAAAQNGPRNNSRDFPEAIPTNDRVQMLNQTDELWKLTYLKDVVYATKDGHDLKLQIVMPQPYDDTQWRFPCIMYVRGSAWMKQDLYADVPQISAMAKRGYVIAIVEYRPSEATFPAQRDDAVTAIEYMRGMPTNIVSTKGTSSSGAVRRERIRHCSRVCISVTTLCPRRTA